MAQQVINVGTTAGDGSGDQGRTAFTKVNSNFTELYATVAGVMLPTYLSNIITVASTNNYDPGGGFPTAVGRIDINPNTVNSTLTGMISAADGQQVFIYNSGTFNLVLTIQDAASSANNRFRGLGSSLTLPPGARTLALYYAGSVNRWSVG